MRNVNSKKGRGGFFLFSLGGLTTQILCDILSFRLEGIDLPEILNEINWLDILFVILLLGMIYKGLRTGVGGQIPSLVGAIVLLYISIGYYGFVSEAIFGFLFQTWTKSISFLIIFAGIILLVKVFERLLSVVRSEDFAILERLGGALIAAFRGFVYCGIVGIFLLLVPIEMMETSVVGESKTCVFFVNFDLSIYNWIKEAIPSEDEKKKTKRISIDQFLDSE